MHAPPLPIRSLRGGRQIRSDTSPAPVPKFGSAGAKAALSPKSAILLCMLSTAYLAHYNAPKYHAELRNPTNRRFNVMTGASFALSVMIFTAVTGLGFATFGGASQGFILNNYATTDR